MKSGGMYRIRGKHFTYSLIALVIATVFLWYLEKKPLVTVLSTLDQLYLPNSDVQLVARDSKDFVIPNYSSPEHGHSRKEPQNEPITDGSVASDVDSTSRINSIMESNGPELTPSLDNYAKKDADQRSNMQDSPHSLDNNDSATHQRSDEPELTSFLDKNDEKDAHKNSDGQELPHSIDSNDRDPHQILDESELTPSLVSNGGKGAHQRSDDLELTPTLDRNGKNDSHQRSHELELTPTLDSNDGEAAHQRSHDQEVTASLDSNDDKDGHHRSNEQELIRPLHSNDEKISLQRSNEQDFTPSLDSNGGKDPHQRSNKQDLTPSLDSNGGKDAHQIPNKQDLALKLASNGGKDAEQRDDGNSEFSSGNKECNYGKGRWVVDNKRHPLYSGFKCKQWLSDMWACRLTWRPDFSYEAYRWQPEGCKMPRFDGPTFLKKMQNKTIAFVGDSLGRQQFQSLMCMVTGGNHHPEVQDVGKKYGFFLSRGAARPNGWAFRFPATNTTILYHWTACLCELEPLNSTDPHSTVAMHLDRAATFLQQFLPALNVVILNTGHHWNRGKLNANRWVMYVGGKPNTDKIRARMGNAKDFTIHSVARWLDEQIGTHHPHVKAFFRTISPRHFAHGDWNTGGSCDNTIPLANGNAVMEEQSRDHAVAGAVRGTRVRLLDVTALSQLRDEGHISRYRSKGSTGFQDCLHWCLPGIPDTWNEILAAQI